MLEREGEGCSFGAIDSLAGDALARPGAPDLDTDRERGLSAIILFCRLCCRLSSTSGHDQGLLNNTLPNSQEGLTAAIDNQL